jgi:hypothetical protein
MNTKTRRKPNFKTIDLAAPLWEPKMGEVCEYRNHSGDWIRCRVLGKPAMNDSYDVELEESSGLSLARFVRIENLREGKAQASKLNQLAKLMKTGNWNDALKMAAKFHDLGDHAKAITQGANALRNPDFYRQIHKDPAALIEAGIAALKERYCK